MESNEIIKYYDQIARSYDKDRFGNSYGRFIDFLERKILSNILFKKENHIVLDLACGTGRFLDFADIGIDASEKMIETARKKFKNKILFVADAERTPLENESVDVILIFHLFMHLNQEKIIAILKECNRILKKGGLVIFDTPSEKRRQLLKKEQKGWHGAFSISSNSIRTLSDFNLVKSFGYLFLPIHRFPKYIRPFFTKIDGFLSNSILKEYSSYLVFEIVKK